MTKLNYQMFYTSTGGFPSSSAEAPVRGMDGAPDALGGLEDDGHVRRHAVYSAHLAGIFTTSQTSL